MIYSQFLILGTLTHLDGACRYADFKYVGGVSIDGHNYYLVHELIAGGFVSHRHGYYQITERGKIAWALQVGIERRRAAEYRRARERRRRAA